MKYVFLFILFATAQTAFTQFHLGVFAGGSTYIGDLNDKPFKRTKPAVGVSLNYELSDRVMLRSGLTFGRLEGGDQYSGSLFLKQNRNLSFQSKLTEFSLVGELTIFNLYNIRWSPYLFGGVAVYHFDPYVEDSARRIFLQPLGTEGQGLTEFPDRKPYALTQFAVPFGGGIKYNINDNIRLGVELGFRRLFTDYLDDVSKTYADENTLLAERGPRAVRLSYRGDEVPGGVASYPDNGYPLKNSQRGNPETSDWYYFTGIHLTFRLNNRDGNNGSGGRKNGYGCPVNPM